MYQPQAGDLVWVDFDPHVGREQGGRRPALIISIAQFSEDSGMAIVCPITSKIRPFPSSTVLPKGLAIQGEILAGQIRSIDTHARTFKFTGTKVPPDTLDEVRAKLAVMMGIE